MTNFRFASFLPATERNVVSFIGRENEWSQLRRAQMTAERGYVQTVFLTGEAGIGKTRLAEEFTRHLRRQGWQMWMGRADNLGDGRAFASLFDAFRMGVTEHAHEAQRDLINKFPYIHIFYPELNGAAPQQLADSGLERTRLFESLRALVVHLSQTRPIVFWIDDLQDADEDTLEWLHYFIRHEEQARIVILATCRTPVAKSAAAFHQLYNTLIRYHLADEIKVLPLSTHESVLLAKSVVDGDVEQNVLQLLHQRTLGVPLFIIELLRMLTEGGEFLLENGKWDRHSSTSQKVPMAITAVIAGRVGRLPERDEQILHLLAVSDVPLPWHVLHRATARDDASLTASLSHLIEMAFVAEHPAEWDMAYGYCHPMMKETVYAMLKETNLRHIHRSLAEAWGNDIVRAAYHIRQSGSTSDVRHTVNLLLAAGQHYLSIRGYRTAVEYLEQAVEVAKRLPPSNHTQGDTSNDVVEEIEVALSEAWTYVERAPEALSVLMKLYNNAQSPTKKIRYKRLMVAVESTRTLETCIQHIESGLKHWDGHTENEDVLWMLNQHVFSFANAGNIERAKSALDALKQYCLTFPSKENMLMKSIREAHLALCDWRSQSPVLDTTTLLLELKNVDNPELAYDAYCLFGYNAINHGDYLTAVRYSQVGVALVRRYGMVIHEISLRLMGMCGHFLAGDWKVALCEADAVERLSRNYTVDVAVACVLDFKALIHAFQGKTVRAASLSKESQEIVARVFPDGLVPDHGDVVTPSMAVALLLKGEIPNTRTVTIAWANMHGLQVFLKLLEGKLQIQCGQWNDVERLILQLRETAPSETSYFGGISDYLEGIGTQAHSDNALKHLQKAIDTFDALDNTLESSLVRLEWATMARGYHPKQAEIQAQQGLDGFRRLGAKPYADAAEALIRKIQAGRADRDNRDIAVGLSARQRDIIACVVQGLSNKQIAEQLVLSTRTVSTHLDQIYRKLNVHSRTALVRAVRQHD